MGRTSEIPRELPERQPVVICSSQRDQCGWRQRVPILWERKGEIAAKSCSYAHNRRMSHPRTHLQRLGSSDTEDNDHVHHPRTGNDRNQKDTDRTASWKRRDRPWFALLEFVILVKVPRGNRCREGLRWLHGEWLTYAKSTSQFHWRCLLKSEMIGASK